jgi:hypothetical protein
VTRDQIRQQLIEQRFPSSETGLDYWIDVAYEDIWGSFDWTFRKVRQLSWWTTADGTSLGVPTQVPLMPGTFQEIDAVYDQNGDELDQLEQLDFDRKYTPQTVGQPCEYTVVDRQIILGPTPEGPYPFLLSFRRTVSCRNAAGQVKAGVMTLPDDTPIWYGRHYIVVIRAKLLGLKDRDDPTWLDLQDEFVGLLDGMHGDYTETLATGYQLPAYRP